ncbi:MAG: tetratricopeptide (TPR) repeat protein [Rhodothermales bacterium]|jgi:tetratricopeptide (TPR) repeat protein
MRNCIAILLIGSLLTGCGKTDVAEVLKQASEATKLNTEEGWKDAHELLSDCIDDHAVETASVHDMQLVALMRSGDSEAAIKAAEAAVAADKTAFVPNYLLGALHIAAKRDQTAVPYLRTAHQARPDHDPTTLLYASCAGRLNLDEAEALYKSLAESDTYEDPGHLYNELAVWYANRQQYPQAMSYFSKAGERSQQNPLVFLNVAVVADFHMKKPAVARTYYLNFLYHANKKYPDREERVRERLRVLSAM